MWPPRPSRSYIVLFWIAIGVELNLRCRPRTPPPPRIFDSGINLLRYIYVYVQNKVHTRKVYKKNTTESDFTVTDYLYGCFLTVSLLYYRSSGTNMFMFVMICNITVKPVENSEINNPLLWNRTHLCYIYSLIVYWIWRSTEFPCFILKIQYSPWYVIFSNQSGYFFIYMLVGWLYWCFTAIRHI